MDASYKQYRYAQGMNLQASVPLDATALLASVQQGATVNAAQGYVQNLNSITLEEQQRLQINKIYSYIKSQGYDGSNTKTVTGSRNIVASQYPVLAGTTPNLVVFEGPELANLPDSMR